MKREEGKERGEDLCLLKKKCISYFLFFMCNIFFLFFLVRFIYFSSSDLFAFSFHMTFFGRVLKFFPFNFYTFSSEFFRIINEKKKKNRVRKIQVMLFLIELLLFFDMSPYQLTLFSHTGIHFRISMKRGS